MQSICSYWNQRRVQKLHREHIYKNSQEEPLIDILQRGIHVCQYRLEVLLLTISIGHHCLSTTPYYKHRFCSEQGSALSERRSFLGLHSGCGRSIWIFSQRKETSPGSAPGLHQRLSWLKCQLLESKLLSKVVKASSNSCNDKEVYLAEEISSPQQVGEMIL